MNKSKQTNNYENYRFTELDSQLEENRPVVLTGFQTLEVH